MYPLEWNFVHKSCILFLKLNNASENYFIMLGSSNLNLKSNLQFFFSARGCSYDSVSIFALENSNRTIGKFCGTNLPGGVSMQGSALIRFVTDRSLVFKGFRIRFQVHSCGGRITEETEIHSPIHPDRYHHNTNCTWIIVAPIGRAVEIKY